MGWGWWRGHAIAEGVVARRRSLWVEWVMGIVWVVWLVIHGCITAFAYGLLPGIVTKKALEAKPGY